MSIEERYEQLKKEYEEMFDDGFPTVPLEQEGIEECIKMLMTCIEQGKSVYELGYVDINAIY